MKAIHIKRLRKLIAFLRKLIAFLRKLPRKRFNFAIVRNEPPKCGAVGCAIGYMPNVFPRVFHSVRDFDAQWTHGVTFKGRTVPTFGDVAMWVSGLEWCKANWLFSPGLQTQVHSKLRNLGGDATPKQVARMLEKFIELQTAK